MRNPDLKIGRALLLFAGMFACMDVVAIQPAHAQDAPPEAPHASPFLPGDDWSFISARRLHALGLTPPGFDRANSSMSVSYMGEVLRYAAERASQDERYGAFAKGVLDRFLQEHPSISRGNPTRILDAEAELGATAHTGAVLPRSLSSDNAIQNQALTDTATLQARAIALAQPFKRMAATLDLTVSAEGTFTRDASVEVSAVGLGFWAGQRTLGYPTSRTGGVILRGDVPFRGVGVHTLRPFQLPSVLRVLGPMSFGTMLSPTHEAGFGDAWFWTARLALQPVSWAGVAVTRGAFAATTDSSGIGFKDVVHLLLGINKFSAESPGYVNNQIVALDGWMRFAFLQPSPMFYWDWGAEDSHGGWWHVPGQTFGLLLPAIPHAEDVSVGVERVLFAHRSNGNPAWYRHGQLTQGWTHNGYLLGDPLGGHGRESLAYLDAHLTRGSFGLVVARGSHGSENTYSPEREGAFTSASVRGSWWLTQQLQLSADAGYVNGVNWTERNAHVDARIRF